MSFLLVLLLAACTDSAGPASAVRLTPLSGVDQAALAGAAVTEVPVVHVADSVGRALPGVRVRWTAIGGGAVSVVEGTTDSTGVTSAGGWTLGPRLGEQVLEASVPGMSVPFRFRATSLPVTDPLATNAACPVSTTIAPHAWELPRAAARLQRRDRLTVVAIGSSSTEGIGASVRDSAYPAVFARQLRMLYPASAITVYNAGVGGQTLSAIRARFETDVFSRAPDLVILQTGSNDVSANVPLDTFSVRLREAIGALRARELDVVLLDQQRYPGVGESSKYQSFVSELGRVGGELGVPLVPRYAWVTELLAGGTYGYSQLLAADQMHPSDLMYHCLGRYLASGVMAATRPPAPVP